MPIEIKREANASTKPHKEEKPMQENRQETSRKKTWYKSSQRRPTKLIFRQFVRLWIVSKGNGKTRSWEKGDKGQLLLLCYWALLLPRAEDAIVLIVIVEQPKSPQNKREKEERELAGRKLKESSLTATLWHLTAAHKKACGVLARTQLGAPSLLIAPSLPAPHSGLTARCGWRNLARKTWDLFGVVDWLRFLFVRRVACGMRSSCLCMLWKRLSGAL